MAIVIDYKNEGWETLNIGSKLRELSSLCGKGLFLEFSELTGGVFNKVILLRAADINVVAKISPLWNQGGLAREAWCYQQINRRTGLRTAKIYTFVSTENTVLPGHEILFMEYLPGHLLTPAEFRKKSTKQKLAAIIKEIHKIPMKGYGWLTSDFAGMYSSWSDFLTSIDNSEITQKSGVLSTQDLQWLTSELARLPNSSFQACLLYGDLKNENILVNGNEIFPVDFQNCFAGHSLYDVGIGLFFNPGLLHDLGIFFTNHTITQENLLTIILYASRHAASVLGHRVLIEDARGTLEAKRIFAQLKKTYLEMA